jgi:hypothetical protein
MNGILDAAVEVDRRLRESGLQYCMIGGVALQRWAEPRMTLDVDVTVMTEFGSELPIVQQLLHFFPPRVADAEDFALESRVLLLKTESGVGIDISLGAVPFEARMIERSSIWTLDEDRALRTCSTADLVIQKAFAGRDQDWLDVQRVIDRQTAEALDTELILRELKPLVELKDDQQAYDRVRRLLDV